MVSKILAASRKIPEQPYISRIVPEVGNDKIREKFVYNYHLVYKIQHQNILILAIIHGKRLLEPLLKKLECNLI